MATLIPAIGSCVSRMTSGEKRFAWRLEDKLEDDYLCWYDVSIGERTRHPDFVVFHPSRGLLVLEVKDWKLDTLQRIDKQHAAILTSHGLQNELNPLEQARQYMYEISNRLERDSQLVSPGSMKGRPFITYGHGVVFTNISRKPFDATGIGETVGVFQRFAGQVRTPLGQANIKVRNCHGAAFQQARFNLDVQHVP